MTIAPVLVVRFWRKATLNWFLNETRYIKGSYSKEEGKDQYHAHGVKFYRKSKKHRQKWLHVGRFNVKKLC